MSLADGYVREIFEALLARRDVDEHTWLLAQCGEYAVPVLLEHLASGDFERQKIACYGLQFCWDPVARVPVEKLLEHADERLRDMGAQVLSKHYSLAEIARVSRRLEDHPHPEVSGHAVSHLEAQQPDLARVRKVLADARRAPWLWKFLPRYYASDLTPGTRALLEDALNEADFAPNVACAALAALAMQNDRSAETRLRARALLKHTHAGVRELAAEFLAWQGALEDAAILRAAAEKEQDVHTGASLRAAEESIVRRCAAWPSAIDHARALEIFAASEDMEPYFAYKGDDPDPRFVQLREARLDALAKLFVISGHQRGAAREYLGDFNASEARRVATPVRDYLDTNRTSFALLSDSTNKDFKGQVHVGDDVAWFRDLSTVAAMADGLVRRAGHFETWGYMVILEHRTARGEFFCSLYAHMSPFVTVRAGECVRLGQKIGSVGRSFTWENGGYAAHLHFAVHRGPYVQIKQPGDKVDVRYKNKLYTGTVVIADANETVARIDSWFGPHLVHLPATWVRGYISPQQWYARRHGFMDPQRVVRENQ